MAAQIQSVWTVWAAVVMAVYLGSDRGLAAVVVLGSGSATVNAGNTALFVCVAYGNQSTRITWSSDSTALDNSTNSTVAVYEEEMWVGGYRFLRSVLEVCRVEPSMDGSNYTCVAEDEDGTDTAMFSITVSISEVLMVFDPEDIQEDSGNTVLIPCVAYSAVRPSITWVRDCDQTVLDNSTSSRVTVYEERVTVRGYTFTKSVLELCSIDSMDVSTYTCAADTGFASNHATFQLTINDPSVTILVGPEDINDETGTAVNTTCVAYSEHLPSISWIREPSEVISGNGDRIAIHEQLVTRDNLTYVQSTLEIHSLEDEDTGIYACLASNGIASMSSTFRITARTECTTILKENCSQICSKISGVDTCLCRDGYRLTEDDITCEALSTSEGGVSTAVIGGAAGAGVVVIAVVVLSLAAIACVLYRRSSHTKTTEYEIFEDTSLAVPVTGPAVSGIPSESESGGHIPTGGYPVLNPIFDPDDDTLLDLQGAEPVYETLDLPSGGGATWNCGKAAGGEEVSKAPPAKQAEEQLRSFETETRPRAVENPYEIQ